MTDNLPERAAIVANKNLVQLDIEQMFRFAQGYARAGTFQGAKYGEVATPEDLFVRISAGQAIGLDPYTSVSEFYFVKGKLVMSTNLQLALAKASGKYDYRVEWGDSLQELGITELPPGLTKQEAALWPTPKWCSITVYSMPEREIIGVSTFTLIDSWRAGLLNPSRNGEPSNHLKYPKNMLFNRAGSNAVAFYMPDATMIRAYDHGEIEGDVWGETRGPSTVTAEVVPEEQAAATEDPEEEIQDADVEETEDEAIHQASMAEVAGEMRPGETAAEAMLRMVAEEALQPFEPETTPPPPVVEAPTWASGETEPQPTVETAEHDPVISPGRRNLVMALSGRAGLTDKRRHEVMVDVTGQPHADRIPDRLFQAVVDRLNDEIQLAEQEVEAVGQGSEEHNHGA